MHLLKLFQQTHVTLCQYAEGCDRDTTNKRGTLVKKHQSVLKQMDNSQ